jgi:hypothetical protein
MEQMKSNQKAFSVESFRVSSESCLNMSLELISEMMCSKPFFLKDYPANIKSENSCVVVINGWF